jgi:hypothetical protein
MTQDIDDPGVALGFVVACSAGKGLQYSAIPAGYFEKHSKPPGAHILYEDALTIIKSMPCTLQLTVEQEEAEAPSCNVWAEIPGTVHPEETVIVGAHLDSVPNVPGTQDNAAGCATALGLARYFSQHRPGRTLRFVWFGGEEMGLAGSSAYVQAHRAELERALLMVNFDVGGGIVGQNFASVMGPQKLADYLETPAREQDIELSCRTGASGSDSAAFAAAGIPALHLGRGGGATELLSHTADDGPDDIDAPHLAMVGGFALEFLERVTRARRFPFDREIPTATRESVKKSMAFFGRGQAREVETDGCRW